jgi:tetratricopeptide (TPR) repeat protein
VSFILQLAAMMLALFLADGFLASLERRELRGEARSFYLRGERLLAQGKAREAVEPLQHSHALVRDNGTYQLALARAMLAAGRLNEAESNLRLLLESDSNDGEANLHMARLQVRFGKNREAEAYYHRAIYGTWPDGDHRSGVRLELARFLSRLGEQKRLLSELLLLQDESAADSAMRKKIASLFIVAGSPLRAADTYRSLLRENPDDPDVYLGLAEAELASGDYDSAQMSRHRALRRRPGEESIQKRLQLVSTLTGLDPTVRRLTSKEKFARSTRLLGLVKADLVQCAQAKHAGQTLQPLISEVERQQRSTRSVTNESAESLLDLTERLWQARLQACGTPASAAMDPLPLLMSKVRQ